MSSTHITYRPIRRYKYQLSQPCQFDTDIRPSTSIESSGAFATLDPLGVLRIKAGYAWDGPSGPAIDTPDFMRGSLAHDCLYQLLREGTLDRSYRRQADQLLRTLCREDGMSWVRSSVVYAAVRLGGAMSSRARHTAPPRRAP